MILKDKVIIRKTNTFDTCHNDNLERQTPWTCVIIMIWKDKHIGHRVIIIIWNDKHLGHNVIMVIWKGKLIGHIVMIIILNEKHLGHIVMIMIRKDKHIAIGHTVIVMIRKESENTGDTVITFVWKDVVNYINVKIKKSLRVLKILNYIKMIFK